MTQSELIQAIQAYIAADPATASKRGAMRKFQIGTKTLNELERAGHFKFSTKRNKQHWFKLSPIR